VSLHVCIGLVGFLGRGEQGLVLHANVRGGGEACNRRGCGDCDTKHARWGVSVSVMQNFQEVMSGALGVRTPAAVESWNPTSKAFSWRPMSVQYALDYEVRVGRVLAKGGGEQELYPGSVSTNWCVW